MRIYFLLLMGAYVLGNIYLLSRAWQALSVFAIGVRICCLLGGILAASALPVIFSLRHAGLSPLVLKIGSSVGSVWLVFTLYMVLFLLLTEVCRLFLPALRYGFWGALGVTCALLLFGYYMHLHPRVNRLTLPLDKAFEGTAMKVVAVSDVHLGHGTGKDRLKRFVEMINAQQPDVILIAGDLIDNDVTPLEQENMAEELFKLQAQWGIYMVPGNHEYISGIQNTIRFLKKTPICLLRDSVVELPNGIQLVGRDDRSRRRRLPLETLLKRTDETRPVILLDHQPYGLAEADALGVDLQFSGHTHHGQVWPMSLLVERMYEQSHGYRRWSHAHIYVSSGLSLWGPPFRVGTRGDMAVLQLTPPPR